MPPMPEAGFTPVGLQPFIVHKVSLTPPAATTWLSDRPRIVDDGGWGGDDSDPAFQLLLHALPRLWERAAGFIGADGIFAGSPVVVDDIVREAVLTDAADRIGPSLPPQGAARAGPVLRPAPTPFSTPSRSPTSTRAFANSASSISPARPGRWCGRTSSGCCCITSRWPDPAARFDDILLTACSDWVNEYSRRVSTIAGLLATFRAPVTKHVPVLAHLMGGLWSLWRDRTEAELWQQVTTPSWLAGLIGVPPRALRFVLGLLSELAIGVIEDHDPRPINRAPVIFSPELVLAGIGIALGAIANNRRLSFVSGWEATARVPEPGTRNTVTTAEVLARQTLSLLIHPGKQQRHAGPVRKLSFTMVPAANTVEPGRLFVAWDGGFQLDEPIGEGVHARIEATGRSFLEQPWGLAKPRGAAGTRLSLSLRFPMSASPLPGLDGAPDAVGGRVVRIRRRADGREHVVRAAPGAERQGGSDQVRAGRRAAAPAAADRRHQPAAGRRGHLVALRRLALRRHRRAGARRGRAAGDGAVARDAVAAGHRSRHHAQPEAGPDHAARTADGGHHHRNPVLQRVQRSACG